jgi:hypothetical protein
MKMAMENHGTCRCEYAGFCGRQHDAVLRDMVSPSQGLDSEQEQGELDVPPEDEEFFAGVVKLYEPLHSACTPAQNMVGRVPLIPSSQVQQEQGLRLPVRLCRLCGCGWKARQQCARGKPVVVAVWSRKAAPPASDGLGASGTACF